VPSVSAGVLTVRIPKAESRQAMAISYTVAEGGYAMIPEQEIVTKKNSRSKGLRDPSRTLLRAGCCICENDDALRLWADMPGVNEKDAT